MTVFSDFTELRTIRLVPGPEQEDPFPDPPAPSPGQPGAPANPAPQGAAAPAGLASTGVSVVGLVGVSVGLVVAGTGAVLAARRRRARQS